MSRYNNTITPQNGRSTQGHGGQRHYWHRLSPITRRSTGGPSAQNPRGGIYDLWMAHEERVIRPHFTFTRIPTIPHPHVHIYVLEDLDNDLTRSTYTRPILPLTNSPPLFPTHMTNQTTTDGSKLTQQEQKEALTKLKKETYNPVPKRPTKPNYYIRDWAIISSRKEKEKDEEGKRCAICLEDFEPKEDVMLTPCSHMFHEECIVPWVKSHGRCPVCRFAICERMREEGVRRNVNENEGMARDDGGLFDRELVNVIRAMGDAFEWDERRPFA